MNIEIIKRTIASIVLRKNVVLPIVALLAEIAIFSLVNAAFATMDSFYTLMGQLSILLILALAETFIILQGSIDLSTAAIMFLSAMVAARFSGSLGIFAIVPALGAGLAIGFVNGIVVVKGKVPSFLATLGMNFFCLGLLMMIAEGKYIPLLSDPLKNLSIGSLVFVVPNSTLLALALFALSTFIAFRTVFGRRIYAVGGAEIEAGLAGAKVDRIKLYNFILSGLLSATAGILLCGRVGGGVPKVNLGFLMDALSAACVGGTSLTGGVGGPHRTIIGASILAVLVAGMNVIGMHSLTQMWVRGIILILIISATLDRSKAFITK